MLTSKPGTYANCQPQFPNSQLQSRCCGEAKTHLKALNQSLFEIGNTAETETSPIAILLLLIICGKTSASVDNGTKTISDLGDLNYWTFDRRVVDISEGIPIKCENENVQL